MSFLWITHGNCEERCILTGLTCSRSFLYLCVACWMRSRTVHPSLQGTTTPVCPNVTVTFIAARSTSSKMQVLWDTWGKYCWIAGGLRNSGMIPERRLRKLEKAGKNGRLSTWIRSLLLCRILRYLQSANGEVQWRRNMLCFLARSV